MTNPFLPDSLERLIWEYGYAHAFNDPIETLNDNPYFETTDDYEYMVYCLGCYAGGYNSVIIEDRDKAYGKPFVVK